MAPPNLKFVTKFNSSQGFGWTEIHYLLAGEETPNLKTYLDNYYAYVVPRRAVLLGESCNIVGVRVSYPRGGAVASLNRRQFTQGNQNYFAADWASSLAIQFTDATNTKSKILHMRGWWDSIAYDESYHPENPDFAAWEPALADWKAALVTGKYGWLSKNPATSASGAMVSYIITPEGFVQFTLPGAGIPNPGGNGIIEVRFSAFNNHNSVLNKQILCQWTNPNLLFSVKQIAAGEMVSTGKYNYRGTAFIQYADTSSISLGERRMGRPLDRYPGRAKARPLT